jgi:hypothetical protein
MACGTSCTEAELPAYTVSRTGIDEEQAHRLADSLRIEPKRLAWRDGLAAFVDTAKHLAVPTVSIGDPKIAEQFRAATTNHYKEIPIDVRAIDYAALEGIRPMAAGDAYKQLASALEGAGASPQHATAVVGHTVFKTVSADGGSDTPRESMTLIDTHVSYRFTLDGYLLVGPGAQVQASFDHEGGVTRLLHSSRDLVAGPPVQLVSEQEMRVRLSRRLPDEAEIELRLVYWAPPLLTGVCASDRWSPCAVIPWYAVTITRPTVDLATGEPQTVTSRVHLVPATDDPRFVPTVGVEVSAPARTRVHARAVVRGGTPPYTYLWAGSNPDASGDLGPAIDYEPVTRDIRRFIPSQSFERTEHVCVTVVDANGVRVQAGASVAVTARPAETTHSSVTYGCESPNDPGPSGDGSYAPERIAWQQAMKSPGLGGGSQRFCWLEDSSWPGDFIEPSQAGALEASPWINGDADHSNWGINTTNIMLYNGDGGPTGFSEMYPGASTYAYNTGTGASLSLPGSGTTVTIGSQGYAVDYTGSWGAPHPRDNLQWLVMYACQILEDDSNARDPWNRWGPAFNGLHSMLGFETNASDNGVGFMTDFPLNMLGLTLPLYDLEPQTVVQAWLNAAIANQMGTPAAFGPISDVTIDGVTHGISDYGDYYWGKGPVGPTIERASISGWWYIQGTDGLQEFP